MTLQQGDNDVRGPYDHSGNLIAAYVMAQLSKILTSKNNGNVNKVISPLRRSLIRKTSFKTVCASVPIFKKRPKIVIGACTILFYEPWGLFLRRLYNKVGLGSVLYAQSLPLKCSRKVVGVTIRAKINSL